MDNDLLVFMPMLAQTRLGIVEAARMLPASGSETKPLVVGAERRLIEHRRWPGKTERKCRRHAPCRAPVPFSRAQRRGGHSQPCHPLDYELDNWVAARDHGAASRPRQRQQRAAIAPKIGGGRRLAPFRGYSCEPGKHTAQVPNQIHPLVGAWAVILLFKAVLPNGYITVIANEVDTLSNSRI